MAQGVNNTATFIEVFDPASNRHSIGVPVSDLLKVGNPDLVWGTPIDKVLIKQEAERFPEYVLVNFSKVSSAMMWIFEKLPSIYQVSQKYSDELERMVVTKRRRLLIGTGVASAVPGRIVEIEPMENTGMEMEITKEIAGWNDNTPPSFPIAMKTRPKMINYRFPDLLKAINIEYAWAWADSESAARSYSEDYIFVFDLIKPAEGPYAAKRYRYLTDNPAFFVERFQAAKLITKYEHPAIVRAWSWASTQGNSTFAVAKELEIPPSIHGTIVIGQPKIAKAIGLAVTELPATPNFDSIIRSNLLVVDVDSSDAGLGLSYVDIIEVNMTGVYDTTPSNLIRLDPSTLGATTPPATTDTGTTIVLPPIVGSDSSEAVIVGRRQTVEAIGTGTVTTAGNIELFFAGESIDGNPASVSVPVLVGDTPEVWIQKAIAVAITIPAITNNWIVCGGLNNYFSPNENSPRSGAIGFQAIYLEINISLGVTSTGTVPFIFTAADVTGSPLTTNIAVASSDSFTEVGPKIVAALTAVAAISSKYTITHVVTSALKGFIYLEAKTIRENIAGVTFTTVGGRGITAAPTSVEYSESGGRRLTMVAKNKAPHDPTVNIGIVANGTGITTSPVSRTLIIGQADETRPALLLGELLKPTAIVSSNNSVFSGVTTKNCFVTLRIYETVGSNLEALRQLYEQRTVSNSLGQYSFAILYPAPRDNNPFDVIVSRRGDHLTTRGSFVDIAPATPLGAINAALTTISGTTEPEATIAGSGATSGAFTGVANSSGVFSITHTFTADEVVTLTAADAGETSPTQTLTAKSTVPADPSAVAFAVDSGSVLVAAIPIGKAAEVVLLHDGSSVGSVDALDSTGVPQNIPISPALNYGQVVGIRTVDGAATSAYVLATAQGSPSTAAVANLVYQSLDGGARSLISGTFAGSGAATVTIKMNGVILDSAVSVDATSRYFSFAINRSHEFGEIFTVTPNVSGGVDSFIERPLTLIPTPNVFFGPPVVQSTTSLPGFRPAFGGVGVANLTDYQVQVGLYNATYSAGTAPTLVQSKWYHDIDTGFELAMPWGRYRDSEQFILGFPNGETAGGTFSKTDLGVTPGGYATVYNGAAPRTPTGIGMNFSIREGVTLPQISAFTVQVINPNTGQKSDKVLWRRGQTPIIIESAL